jgi:beta-galactosidase
MRRLAGDIPALAADPLAADGDIDVIVRRHEDGRYVFLANRTDAEVVVTAAGDLLAGAAERGASDAVTIAPRGVAVLAQEG